MIRVEPFDSSSGNAVEERVEDGTLQVTVLAS